MADLDALAGGLVAALDHDCVGWLQPKLLRLLSAGEPVTAAALAAATGRLEPGVRAGLAKMLDTEYDDAGRVVGFGITLRPTPHRFEVDGQHLFTWCALDTLMFPLLIGRPAQDTSPCHATGQPVRVAVEPGGVRFVDPAGAVVSIVTPGRSDSVRGSFCNQVHFFASAAAAGPWLSEHPDATVLSVTEAFELGKPFVAQMRSRHGRLLRLPRPTPTEERTTRMKVSALIEDLAVAAAAGYLGTRAMEPVSMKLYELESDADREREDAARPGPPYEIAAKKIAGLLGVTLQDKALERASLAAHYGLALSWSPLYLLLRRTTGLRPVVAGLSTGAAMSAVADEWMTPALGFSAPNRAYPLATHLRGVAAHLVFGLGVAATTEALWAVRGRRP